MWVSCEGEGKADVELMKNVTLTYGNNMGYPAYYYPFKNQPGYQAPFVTIQLGNLPSKCAAIELDRVSRLVT